jgi:hypothetical protein
MKAYSAVVHVVKLRRKGDVSVRQSTQIKVLMNFTHFRDELF